MPENEVQEKIAQMCAHCAFLNPEKGTCKHYPPYLSKTAQEQKLRDGLCIEAGVYDTHQKIIKAVNSRNVDTWVLQIQ